MFRYFIVSGVALIVDLSLTYSLTEFFKIYYLLSSIIGNIVGLVINYILNNKYVSVLSLLGFHKETFTGFLTKAGDKFGVFDKMRLNIVLCGLGGLIGGIIIGYFIKRR